MAIITDYATLQTAVADYLVKSNLTTFIPNFIQNAENKLYRTLNLRNEERQLSVPIGGGIAPLPYRFKQLKFAYVDRSPIKDLEWASLDEIYRQYPDRSELSDRPNLISREGNHFVFGPPSTDGTLKGIYHRKPRSLTATSETTAETLVEDGLSSTHLISQATTLTDAIHTFSVYAKATGSPRNIELRATSSNVTAAAVFDPRTGQSHATTGDQFKAVFVENAGDDWYRFGISLAAEAASTTHAIYLTRRYDEFTETYTGDSTSGVYVWGAQSEQSPYPTELAITDDSTDAGYKNRLEEAIDFNTSASWTPSGVTVSANSLAPPIEIGGPAQNWYTENAPEVLLYGALLEAKPFIMDDARIPVWQTFFNEAVSTLIEEEKNASTQQGTLRQRAEVVV